MREKINTYESPSLLVIETLPSEVLCMSTPSDLEKYDVLPEFEW